MPHSAPIHQVGKTLKARRRELNLTLADLGASLGLANGNFIGMVERGERMPSDERLLALAGALDLDGRALVAMKYRESDRSAIYMLLSPPEPELPRLRRYLLSECTNPGEAAAEFESSPRGALERIVFQVLLAECILPAMERDRYAPRRLRDRLIVHRDRGGSDLPDARWFEDEAATFVSWAKGQSVVQSWTLDLVDLQVRVVDRDGRELRLALVPARGREAGGPTEGPAPSGSTSSPLDDRLRDEGLSAEDVAEILDLVEWKKSRAERRGAGD